jgi:hypothetical protein
LADGSIFFHGSDQTTKRRFGVNGDLSGQLRPQALDGPCDCGGQLPSALRSGAADPTPARLRGRPSPAAKLLGAAL